MKYARKEDALHLKVLLEAKYKVTKYWDFKHYVGISLTLDYDKDTFQLDMPGYVHAVLHSFQHKNPKKGQDYPYPWTPILVFQEQ